MTQEGFLDVFRKGHGMWGSLRLGTDGSFSFYCHVVMFVYMHAYTCIHTQVQIHLKHKTEKNTFFSAENLVTLTAIRLRSRSDLWLWLQLPSQCLQSWFSADGSADVLVDEAKAKTLADFGFQSDTLLSDVGRWGYTLCIPLRAFLHSFKWISWLENYYYFLSCCLWTERLLIETTDMNAHVMHMLSYTLYLFP